MGSAVYQSQTVVLSQYIRNAQLSVLTARPAGPLLGFGAAHLSHDPTLNPVGGTPLASLQAQEANFSGYTPQTPTPVVPVNQGPNTQGLIYSVVFEAAVASPFQADNITGYWWDDATNMTLAERFANNQVVGIAAPNDYVRIDVCFPLYYRQQATPPL